MLGYLSKFKQWHPPPNSVWLKTLVRNINRAEGINIKNTIKRTDGKACSMEDENGFQFGFWKLERSQFIKNSGLKFWKFYVPNGTVHSGCTDSTQATAQLLIVLANSIQTSGTILSNGKEHFSPTDQNELSGQSGSPSVAVPNIPPGRSEPKGVLSISFLTEIFGLLGWMEIKRPLLPCDSFSKFIFVFCNVTLDISFRWFLFDTKLWFCLVICK